MFGFLSPDPLVEITIDSNIGLEQYKKRFLNIEHAILTSGDSVKGNLNVIPPPGKAVRHNGIELYLIGEVRKNNGEPLERFYVRKQELVPMGDLKNPISTKFSFDHVQFPCSSFIGNAICVVYYIQVVVVHKVFDFKVEEVFSVIHFSEREASLSPIHNEVGIRNILHIEFVFPNSVLDCNEPLIGSVYFILVKLRIVHMSLSLFQSELFSSESTYIKRKTELKTIEIMDGAPVRGDHIPIRFFISDGNFWPFSQFKGSKLRVDHYIKAQLIDENGKKYFKRLKVEFTRFSDNYPGK